jgi:hypothetical protein
MKVGFIKAGALGLTIVLSGIAFSQRPITVTVNGVPVQFKSLPPQMDNGHVTLSNAFAANTATTKQR